MKPTFLLSFSLSLFWVALTLLPTACAAPQPVPPTKARLGWVEEIHLADPEFHLDAKLDTGADTSSIHAENIQIIRREKRLFVRFEVENRDGEEKTLVLPLERKARIKKKGVEEIQIRPVVKLGVCLGEVFEVIEFSLVDRSHFEYPVLIGRNFLAGNVILDPSRSFSQNPSCGVPSEQGGS